MTVTGPASPQLSLLFVVGLCTHDALDVQITIQYFTVPRHGKQLMLFKIAGYSESHLPGRDHTPIPRCKYPMPNTPLAVPGDGDTLGVSAVEMMWVASGLRVERSFLCLGHIQSEPNDCISQYHDLEDSNVAALSLARTFLAPSILPNSCDVP